MRCGLTNAGAREDIKLSNMFSRRGVKPDVSLQSQWAGATINLSRPSEGRTSIAGCTESLTDVFCVSQCPREPARGVLASSDAPQNWDAEVFCSSRCIKLLGPPGSVSPGEPTWHPARPRCAHTHPYGQNISCSLKQLLVVTCSVTGNRCKMPGSQD